jgi:hypothetical protein
MNYQIRLEFWYSLLNYTVVQTVMILIFTIL